jgi:hypothetical protein
MDWLLGLAGLAPIGVFVFVVRRWNPDLAPDRGPPARRILLALIGDSIPCQTIDVALELARSDGAGLVLTHLMTVPFHLALEVQYEDQRSIPLPERIRERAARLKVPVDARVEVGRTPRHALGALVGRERFDRLVIPAATRSTAGFSEKEVTWLLGHAPGEILVLRPQSETKPRPG